MRLDLLADVRLAIIDDDHRAIGQIADPLSLVAAFAHDLEMHHFTGNHRRLHQVRDLVQIYAFDILQPGHLGKVCIIGVQLGVQVARQADQLGVHTLFIGKITVMDAHFDLRVVLQPVQHLESAPAARTLDLVRRIRDLLQFQQHETRHHDQALDQLGLNQIRDASVDDDARIQQQQVVRLVLWREADIGDDE